LDYEKIIKEGERRDWYGEQVPVELITDSVIMWSEPLLHQIDILEGTLNDLRGTEKEKRKNTIELLRNNLKRAPYTLNGDFYLIKIARNEIIRKVKEAEKNKKSKKKTEKTTKTKKVTSKKVGLKNIVMDIDGFEAVIHESGLIARENFRVGDRIRCYIEDVRKEAFGAQIFLSRTHPQFLVKLFEQEVPELNDGNIEVKAVARDAGSRSKIAIYSRRDDIDIIGSFIGIRGNRVQSVSSELRGEKIDIIKWSSNIAELVISSLTPAKVSKVVVDEENNLIEVVVAEDQLSLAIGRGGQNVKLASKLVGYKIDVMTDEQESARRTAEFNQASKLFIEALDVEDMIASLLASEGLLNIESLANAEISDIASIEGFDEDIAGEIKRRAEEFLQKNS